jgi:hypothetical protein
MRNRFASAQSAPLLLHLTLKFEIEDCKSDIARLLKILRRPVKACMHGKRSLSYVVVTHETERECRERIKDELERLESIDGYWIFPAPKPDHVVGRVGPFDPLAHWLRLGWVEAREWRDSENMRERERG